MFTGIVEHVGRVESLEKDSEGGRLPIHAGPLGASLAVAGSIAVNGCCLTVIECTGEVFAADLSSETLKRTAFGEMKPGARVNLERPLTAGKELGGHFVQGHVDGIGRVARLAPEGSNWWLAVRVPGEVLGHFGQVPGKGSLAVSASFRGNSSRAEVPGPCRRRQGALRSNWSSFGGNSSRAKVLGKRSFRGNRSLQSSFSEGTLAS